MYRLKYTLLTVCLSFFLDTVDREFKANIEHWTVIINYCELYPNMLKNKFGHSDGDSLELKQRWQELTHQLNSLGYGKKSMEKWQLVGTYLLLCLSYPLEYFPSKLHA